KLTPQLSAGTAAPAVRPLQRNASIEAGLGLVIIVIVGALGTIPPALHLEPWWPLPVRFDTDARFFIVPAFPTSFYRSHTNFTFASIARGQALFAQHCVGCHGASGRGNGPNALALDMPTSDLTAAHVYAHSDGDLFWWIGHGMGDTMPGFGDAIDDQ